MFNIDTFNAHKQGIRENMESNLIWDKHHNKLDRVSSTFVDYADITIKFDDEPEVIATKMEYVSDLLRSGTKVTQEEVTEQPYCTVYMIGVRYAYEIPQFRSRIEDRQVTNAMKKYMEAKIRRETNRPYVDLECKVMDLFKAGIIDWDMVLESHGKDCSL